MTLRIKEVLKQEHGSIGDFLVLALRKTLFFLPDVMFQLALFFTFCSLGCHCCNGAVPRHFHSSPRCLMTSWVKHLRKVTSPLFILCNFFYFKCNFCLCFTIMFLITAKKDAKQENPKSDLSTPLQTAYSGTVWSFSPESLNKLVIL